LVRPIEAFVVRDGEGESIAGPAGGAATIKAREDEMWYILDGSFRFIADTVDPDLYREIAAGSWMEVTGPPLGESHPL
jgi:hypothetical protein